MKLTPIKGPAKRRRPRSDDPVVVPAQSRKRLKRKSESKPESVPQPAPKPKASLLESLIPLEIMERIFWESENVNLARASPLLGRFLSGESTRRGIVIAAFGPTWDFRYGYRDIETSELPSHQDDTSSVWYEGDPGFQSSLLEHSSITVAFIHECWGFWVRQHRGDVRRPYASDWGRSGNLSGIPRAFSTEFGDFCRFKLPLPKPRSAWLVHKEARIPDALLLGPWKPQDAEKLFWLIFAGASLAPDQTWEVTRQAFQNAVPAAVTPGTNPLVGINMLAVRMLKHLDAFEAWPPGVRDEEASRVNTMYSSFGDNVAVRCVNYVLSSQPEPQPPRAPGTSTRRPPSEPQTY
ncbi:hypothetical protein GGS23DRAFT_548891 [Durotheca rogersii]|uniref:uncharacterized protein n=1 Tax=Durotheca rogersii TaxID=419775 RepID=UPI002220FB0C|nr:uncharacterized protein GGS23DRAFT_548891 [Durotheca rogersii]KAI5867570.1 hypothetical protein GGS23DRAFT_548891 [Durotheca rogersii]